MFSVAALIYRARPRPHHAGATEITTDPEVNGVGRKHEPNDSEVTYPGSLARIIEPRRGLDSVAADIGVPRVPICVACLMPGTGHSVSPFLDRFSTAHCRRSFAVDVSLSSAYNEITDGVRRSTPGRRSRARDSCRSVRVNPSNRLGYRAPILSGSARWHSLRRVRAIAGSCAG